MKKRKHRRKGKARRNVMPHRCMMCGMAAPKRKNGKDRWRIRDLRNMTSGTAGGQAFYVEWLGDTA